jgi:hypothetical protein
MIDESTFFSSRRQIVRRSINPYLSLNRKFRILFFNFGSDDDGCGDGDDDDICFQCDNPCLIGATL